MAIRSSYNMKVNKGSGISLKKSFSAEVTVWTSNLEKSTSSEKCFSIRKYIISSYHLFLTYPLIPPSTHLNKRYGKFPQFEHLKDLLIITTCETMIIPFLMRSTILFKTDGTELALTFSLFCSSTRESPNTKIILTNRKTRPQQNRTFRVWIQFLNNGSEFLH